MRTLLIHCYAICYGIVVAVVAVVMLVTLPVWTFWRGYRVKLEDLL